MKQVAMYEASDGEQFTTAEKCRAHEKAIFVRHFIGLQDKQIIAALNRADTPTDIALSNAFEQAGAMIAKKRRENGELKRVRAASPPLEPLDKKLELWKK